MTTVKTPFNIQAPKSGQDIDGTVLTFETAVGWVLRPPTGGSGSVDWGDITGTLSDQTDLQAELDAKLTEAEADALYDALGAAAAAVAAHEAAGNPHSQYLTEAEANALYDALGAAAAAVAAHEAAGDPHPQYLTTAEGNANYQGLDATLTALAGLNATAGLVEQTGSDAFTKRAIGVGASTSILTRGDGDTRYDAAGAAAAAQAASQPLDPTLTALAGLSATVGLVEETGADAFTKRAIGVASATDILTRADGDGRYPQKTGTETISGSWTYSFSRSNAAAPIILSSAVPALRFQETDAAVDNTQWDIYSSAGDLKFSPILDDGSGSGVFALSLERTGNVVDAIRIPRDTTELTLGVGNDLRFYHDGTNSYVHNVTGALVLRNAPSGALFIQQSDGAFIASFSPEQLVLGSGAAAADVVQIITGAAGRNRDIRFQTAGVNRWLVRTNVTAEGGANLGSNFDIVARDDAGANIATVMQFMRAAPNHISMVNDNQELRLGISQDLRLYHNGTDSVIENDTGLLRVRANTGMQFEEGYAVFGHTGRLFARGVEIDSSGNNAGVAMGRFSADVSPPVVEFIKSRNAAIGSHTVVVDGDGLGVIDFYGSDGATHRQAASIRAFVDGVPGASDMPGRLSFWTTPDASATLAERFRISNTGAWGLSGANFGSASQVLTSNGSGSAPTWQAGGGGGGSATEVDVDFGTIPQYDANFVVVDGTVSPTSKIIISESGKIAAGRVAAGDGQWDSINPTVLPGTGNFTVFCRADPGPVVGKRTLHYMVL